jgi:hypothetical protein
MKSFSKKNFSTKTSVHPIAKLYFDRVKVNSGVDIIEKREINNFIIGLVELNLLDSLVECWSFRSTQNAGTGSVGYGLINRFNASIMNGATWGINGVTLNGTNQWINTNCINTRDNNWNFFCGKRSSGTFGDLYSSGTNEQFVLTARTDGSATTSLFDPSFRVNSGLDNLTSYATRGLSKSPISGTLRYLNKTILGNLTYSGPYNAASQPIILGARNAVSPAIFLNGEMNIFMVFSGHCNLEKYINLHNLYKDTLGKGLELP